ncbi:MAG: DUF4416 family protein [Caldiserica bacterium]|nr:DUF4416 family protein [Caldisericota bacterium]
MGIVKEPDPVKLFFAEFTSEVELFPQVEHKLADMFGDIDFSSPLFDFNYTDYYAEEMGKNLKKKFVSFKKLINPQELSRIKRASQVLEEEFSRNGKRRINLDPGYLSLSKVVLASTKDSYHRLYLGNGIYGEVTLYFFKGSYQPLSWTYPDYCSDDFREIFATIRKRYKDELQKKRKNIPLGK